MAAEEEAVADSAVEEAGKAAEEEVATAAAKEVGEASRGTITTTTITKATAMAVVTTTTTVVMTTTTTTTRAGETTVIKVTEATAVEDTDRAEKVMITVDGTARTIKEVVSSKTARMARQRGVAVAAVGTPDITHTIVRPSQFA